MTRRVNNSLAERRLLLEPYVTPLEKFLLDLPTDRSPTGRRDTVTTNTLDLKPQTLTLEALMEAKRQFEEMEIGNLPAFPDFSQIERRITASIGIDREDLHFWRPGAEAWPIYESPRITTHKYEEHRQKTKAMQEAQAAERTRKSYEELFV